MRAWLTLTIRSAACALGVASADSALASESEQALRGREVYALQHCQRCHAIAGQGNRLRPLDAVGSKYDAAELRRRITAEGSLRESLSGRAQAAKRRNAALPAEQLDALVAYLRSLPEP